MYMDVIEKDPNRNRRNGLIVFVICVILMGCMIKCAAQVYKAVDIPQILGRTDSVSKLELLTSKKFHVKLNEYRKQKGVLPVRWSDTLYIVAMNHNSWMTLNKTRLTHLQWDMTYYFTGIEPENRAEYVCDERIWWIGENLAWFGWNKGTMEEMAETGALTAFNLWKNSKLGHNEQMLDKSNTKHAAHFSCVGGYCASEFAGKRFVRK